LTTRIDFPDAASARSFREALLGADTVDAEVVTIAAEAAGGTVQELGNVAPGGQPEVIDAALFNFENGMEALGESGLDISEVLTVTTPAAGAQSGGAASGGTGSGGASGGAGATPQEQFAVLVATRTPERVRPLSEVREIAEQGATQQQQTQAQQAWLDGLREDIPVENLLAAQAAAGAQSGGALSGGSVPLLTPTPLSGGAN
jgi:hypothetical protein